MISIQGKGVSTGVVQGCIDSPVPVILTADDLAPSETVQLDKSKILSFVTEGGTGSVVVEGTQARRRVIFTGRVRHVGFRYTAYYLAKKLYLTGWARYLTDGRVIPEAQGGVSRIRKLVSQLKSQPHIHIEHTQIEEIPLLPHDRGFKVISGM